MLVAAALSVLALAAAPAPQRLVLAPADVPSGYRLVAAASGPTAPNAYRSAFVRGSTVRLSSVAVVFADARGAAAMVAAPSASCGGTATTRRAAAGARLGPGAVVCESAARGFVGFAVAWRDGRVFATIQVVGRKGEVTAALALRLARAQEARIAAARAAAPLAA